MSPDVVRIIVTKNGVPRARGNFKIFKKLGLVKILHTSIFNFNFKILKFGFGRATLRLRTMKIKSWSLTPRCKLPAVEKRSLWLVSITSIGV